MVLGAMGVSENRIHNGCFWYIFKVSCGCRCSVEFHGDGLQEAFTFYCYLVLLIHCLVDLQEVDSLLCDCASVFRAKFGSVRKG